MGMVMSAAPIYNCFNSLYNAETEEKPHLIYMSPKGTTFTQKKAIELSQKEHIVILCGHYEGVDQRVIDEIVDEEISIGDFVLTGGELPALTVTDAVCRMLPGVLSDTVCFTEESHFDGLLEYPQYTKPDTWMDRKVPEVLLSGHHANISKWRREQAIEETYLRRPDILDESKLSKKELAFLKKLKENVTNDQ
jgi:tRNA (guanine37-N1)-methyltransferase